MSIQSFASDAELLKYASWLLRNRVSTLRKDTDICMTANAKREHAYFPALITCIAFTELLSGLYAGKLEHLNMKHIQDYIARFFRNSADYKHFDILYFMFRHKIAHNAYPYPIFDTRTKNALQPPHRRIVWTVGVYSRREDN
jgi:hypothetical protein